MRLISRWIQHWEIGEFNIKKLFEAAEWSAFSPEPSNKALGNETPANQACGEPEGLLGVVFCAGFLTQLSRKDKEAQGTGQMGGGGTGFGKPQSPCCLCCGSCWSSCSPSLKSSFPTSSAMMATVKSSVEAGENLLQLICCH